MNSSIPGAVGTGLLSTVAGLMLSLTLAQNGGAGLADAAEEVSGEPTSSEAAPAGRLAPRAKAKPKPAAVQTADGRSSAAATSNVTPAVGYGGSPGTPPGGSLYAQPARSSSPVQQQLEELYRKNGREMPSMDLNQYEPPMPGPAPAQSSPNVPAGRNRPATPVHGGGFRSSPRQGKPNFLERIFHFGRGRHREQELPEPQQRPAPQQQPSKGPVRTYPVPPGARSQPAPQGMPYGPYGQSQQAPSRAPMSAPATSQPAAPAFREPAPLEPAAPFEATPQPETYAGPSIRSRESRPLLDESTARDDDESLDLPADDELRGPATEPQVRANQPPAERASSPYTGLTISPNETENDMARPEEKHLATPSGEAPAEAAATPEPSPVFALPNSEAAPAAAAVPPASRLDEELPDLDREEREAQGKAANMQETAPTPPVAAPPVTEGRPENSLNPPASLESNDSPKAPAEGPKLLKGFQGYCPVLLKDERRLVESKREYTSMYRGKSYQFSSEEAKLVFEENPLKYVPARGGNDVVRLASGDDDVPGMLEYAAWYRGRLYLFSSPETRKTFVESPGKFRSND